MRSSTQESSSGDRGGLARRVATHAAAAGLGALLVWISLVRPEAASHRRGSSVGPDPLRAPPSAFPWSQPPGDWFAIPTFARFLNGVDIVLDPGHGGRSDRPNWKRGPTGLQEAEVNLKVALFLREFLVVAGAVVTMTRETDIYLHEDDGEDLSRRIAIANERGADLFLSVHHNAADSPTANYTTVFYHGGAETSLAGLDAARHLLGGLDDALRLEQRVGVALVSDFEIYPDKGFRVLREARVPAVLSEASFHSNPQEEERLRDPLYNRREAYGLFLGLARWAQAGLPRVQWAAPSSAASRSRGWTVRLDDGLSARGGIGSRGRNIREDSIVVRWGDRPASFRFDAQRREIDVDPPASRGADRLYVDFRNIFGQHVLHPWLPTATAPASPNRDSRRP